jgi:hypothetical protein
MMKAVLLALLLVPVQDVDRVDRVDRAIARFRGTWKKSREESVRAGAIIRLTNLRDPKILACLTEKLPRERSPHLREKLVFAIGQYTDNADAAGILFDELKRNRDFPNVIQVALQNLGGMETGRTRPRVREVNRFIPSRDLMLAISAIRALGFIRHKSSVTALVDRLRRCQQDMRKFIMGEKLPDCSDGG